MAAGVSTVIVDPKGNEAFRIDVSKKSYSFGNVVLGDWIKLGVDIPPYLRDSFANKKVIYPPDQSASAEEYELFKKAVLLYYNKELSSQGYKVFEEPSKKG